MAYYLHEVREDDVGVLSTLLSLSHLLLVYHIVINISTSKTYRLLTWISNIFYLLELKNIDYVAICNSAGIHIIEAPLKT